MKYSITCEQPVVTVRIDDLVGTKEKLMQEIELCRRSAWACPSGECQNVGRVEDHSEGESLFLTFVPRAGVELDVRGLEQCLGYMFAQATRV